MVILMHLCSVAKSCPTLCDPMDCSKPGSSVHGIFWARILDQVAISYSRYLPDQGSNLRLLCLLHWKVDSLPLSNLGSLVFMVDAENSDKIQHPLIMKSLIKENTEEKYLNLKCHWLPVQEWQSRRMCTHLLQEYQNCNQLLNNH